MIDEGLSTKDENNSYLYIFQQDEITRNYVDYYFIMIHM